MQQCPKCKSDDLEYPPVWDEEGFDVPWIHCLNCNWEGESECELVR